MTFWTGLRDYAATAMEKPIAERLNEEGRVDEFSLEADGLLFDYSKTSLDRTGLNMLISRFNDMGVAARRDAMFEGKPINETEGRAVLHTALRNLGGDPVMVDGQDVMPGVLRTLKRMEEFAMDVRMARLQGTGGPIRHVVNIGIGGSDLGPVMAVRALSPWREGPATRFVSNVDSADIADALHWLDPMRTLVIVSSKTFTTVETLTNARDAKRWMERGGGDPAAQFAAVSTDLERTRAFGIKDEHVFGFDDWVGGRYSLWGPIGLALMLSIGPKNFRDFLRGGNAMDQHFRRAPAHANLPVLLAMIGIWHHQGCGYSSRAVLPYENRLARLPAYLQQLEMESNGKAVQMDGTPLDVTAGPIVWGEPGTNGQHAFYQLIHQGKEIVPCEFLVGARGHEPELEFQHHLLVANCLAQSKALMMGRSPQEARKRAETAGFEGADIERLSKHMVFTGDRPSTTLLYPQLTPYVLGQIIALYEHRVFVEGVMLGINSFDQWGVELGKEMAQELGPVVSGEEDATDKDASTQLMVRYLRRQGRTGVRKF